MKVEEVAPGAHVFGDNRFGIRTFLGDSIALMRTLVPGSVDLVLTDPPYLMDYQTNHRKEKEPEPGSREHMLGRKIENDSGLSGRMFVKRYIPLCFEVLKDGGAAYFFCKMDGPNGEDLLGTFKKMIVDAGFKIANTIIWVKDNWTAGDLKGSFGFQYEVIIFAHKGRHIRTGKRWSDVWTFPRVPDSQRVHPHQKPLDLLERAVTASCPEGGMVLDGCGGSLSTAAATALAGGDRKCIVCEFDEDRYRHGVEYVTRELNRDKPTPPPTAAEVVQEAEDRGLFDGFM